MRYLLDTNILSDLIRNPQGSVAKRIAEAGEENVCTSVIVAAELRYGAARRNSSRLTTQDETVLEAIEIMPLEAPVDETYGELRAELERRGMLIGPNDLLIAAQTLCLGYRLVTDNEGEFRRVEGLSVENWKNRGETS